MVVVVLDGGTPTMIVTAIITPVRVPVEGVRDDAGPAIGDITETRRG